jgi:hypothetical protein
MLCFGFSHAQTHAAEEDKWRTAGNTLLRYIANAASNPDEEKFRWVRLIMNSKGLPCNDF